MLSMDEFRAEKEKKRVTLRHTLSPKFREGLPEAARYVSERYVEECKTNDAHSRIARANRFGTFTF